MIRLGYMRVRRWVDAQWTPGGQRFKVLLLPVLPVAFPFMRKSDVALWLGIAWAVGWLGFITWRGVRMAVAGGKRGDRQYDRADKFILSEEYHATESATAATQRERRAASVRSSTD